MGIPDKGREKGKDKTFERKMTENFPKLMLDQKKKKRKPDLVSSENTLWVIVYTFINVPL